ncbi:type IV secretion system protein [Neisseria sp. oral taxon 014]|uniref:type IV secretion system protein n=2 Tax=Neisseria sp. oral taxon 014 TaxID=641148 RepID=UPI00110ACB6C|nr:type IV secretion system protein [Neisseria sp. oral taxon 014]
MDNTENLGFFILIKTYVEILIMKFGDRGLSALSTVLIPSLMSMVTVWLMFEGYRILNGQSREPLNMFLWRGAKMVVIITVASWIMNNPTGLRDWISEHIKNPIASVIVGGEYASPEAMVDSSLLLMHLIMGAFGSLQAATSNDNGSAFSNFIMASGVAQGTPAVVAGALLLLNEIALSLAILTAPAFILCLLYDPTKQYFQGWLKFFLGSLLTMAVLSVMVTIGLKVMLVYATKVLGEYGVGVAVAGSASQDRPGIAQITIMQGGLGLMMSTLMITAPLLVGNLIGSSLGGFSGYNMFSGGNVPRDSNNNPLVQDRSKKDDGGATPLK